MNAEMKKKVQMVDELNDTLCHYVPGVSNVSYKVFVNDRFKREYAVVEFIGGNKCVRNCSGDSCSCIVSEIAKMLNGGYYEELREYNALVDDPNWDEISDELEKL